MAEVCGFLRMAGTLSVQAKASPPYGRCCQLKVVPLWQCCAREEAELGAGLQVPLHNDGLAADVFHRYSVAHPLTGGPGLVVAANSRHWS